MEQASDMPVTPSPSELEYPPLLEKCWLRMTVRGFAALAGALCGWLTWQKFSGQITALAGCGGEGGCHQVLGGRWSSWMGLPVSLWALGLYLGVLVLTLRLVQAWLRLQADRLLCAAAITVILAAVWFIGILAVEEKAFCPFCAAAHGLGLGFAVPLLATAWRVRGDAGSGLVIGALSVAAPAFALLVFGQLFGPRPDTHQITTEHIKLQNAAAPTPLPPATPTVAQDTAKATLIPRLEVTPALRVALPEGESPQTSVLPVEGRVVGFFNNEFRYNVEELPLLGKKDAQFVMVEYFDYTCRSCRDMAGDLKAMQRTFGQAFAVVLLPCPLNRQCNPHLPGGVEDHAGSCELTQLALAVWRLAPEKFLDFHALLLAATLPVNVATATAEAESRVGGREALAKALRDPWIKQRVSETVNQYRLFSSQNIHMPKLLLKGSVMMHGPASSESVFLDVLREQFGVK